MTVLERGWLLDVNTFLIVDKVITLLGRRAGGFATPMNCMNSTLSMELYFFFNFTQIFKATFVDHMNMPFFNY